MTTKQALAEARRRWGKTARIERRFIGAHEPNKKTGKTYCYTNSRTGCGGFHWSCNVGRIALGMFFEVNGSGETFDAAFAEVDRIAALDRARYAKIMKGVK